MPRTHPYMGIRRCTVRVPQPTKRAICGHQLFCFQDPPPRPGHPKPPVGLQFAPLYFWGMLPHNTGLPRLSISWNSCALRAGLFGATHGPRRSTQQRPSRREVQYDYETERVTPLPARQQWARCASMGWLLPPAATGCNMRVAFFAATNWPGCWTCRFAVTLYAPSGS